MHRRCRLLRPLPCLHRGVHSSAPPAGADASTDTTLLGRLTRLLLLHRFPAAARLLSFSPFTATLLHAALRRVRLDPDAALHVFRLAPSRPSLLAHAQLLHILARARRSADARALLASLLSAKPRAPPLLPHLVEVYKDFSFSAASFDMLFRALADAGQLASALQVFDEMPKVGCRPTMRSCNVVLNRMVQAEDLGAAEAVFKQMKDAGIVPDEFTAAIMAKAYCRDGRVSYAMKFLEEMEKMGVEVNLVAYHAVMDAYCALGQTEDARKLFELLRGRGLSPNVVTYTLLLKGYTKEGRMEEAERILREITENEHVTADEVAYGAVINGYCQKGGMENAARVRNEMMSAGFQVNLFVYNAMINGYSKLGRMVEAHKVLHEMEEVGFVDVSFSLRDEMLSIGLTPVLVTNVYLPMGDVDDSLFVWVRKSEDSTYNLITSE
ncbi:hypothetical protein QOZ80_5AG0400330 [Eleusine coracana subsp. coracana]|nr:hypothetical protein QOZ80_5AG0400330 [Eleusine coracana subsp. coracana]